jgi:hypothetical protein
MEIVKIELQAKEWNNYTTYNKTTRFEAIFNNTTIGTFRLIRTINNFNLIEFINLNNIKYYIYNTYGLLNNFEVIQGFSFTIENGTITINIPEGIIE